MSLLIGKLMRRSLAANRLGFAFFGTTHTSFPKSVRLRGKRIILSAPSEPGALADVINVWLDDEYGLRAIEGAPKTIMDIGGNIGIFSLWATHCFPDARIHAYEPNPRAFRILESNLRGMPVNIFSTGLGAKPGRAEIIDEEESRLASTRSSPNGKIEIEPLARAIERLGGNIDLMKIDCEGAEWDLFEDRTSFKRVKNIRIEYHLVNGHTIDEFKAIVAELGFSILKLSLNQGYGVAWLNRNGV